jgi:subtilase family serine protease
MSRSYAGGRSPRRGLGILLIVVGAVLMWGVGPSLFLGWSQAGAPSLPELHPISLVLSPASPVDKGVALVARAKIVNTGGSPAPRFAVEFFYRLKSDPARPWVSFPDGKGMITLPQGLSPRDQAVTVEGTLDTGKAEIEPGLFEIRVLVDSGNQISEQDETNNELIVGLQIRPSRLNKPDLVPTALLFTPPSPIDGQTTVTVSATVRNNGPVDAGAFDVQYLFCKLPAPRSTCAPEQLVEFARAAVTGLKAGEERSGRQLHGATEIQFPNPKDPSTAKLDPGTYLVQVRVDPTSREQPNGAVEEQDEANNSLAVLLTVKGPELYPESILVAPTPLRAGDEAIVTTQIANAGAAPAENVSVAFFVDGRRFAVVQTSLPAAEQTGAATNPARQTVQASLKTAEVPPGVHELRVVVDPDDRVSELDESNNALTTALTLQPAVPQLPELAPKSLIVTPASPMEQGTGTVTAEIINTGAKSAESFDVEFSVREAGRLRWNPITCRVNCTNNKLNPNAELTAQAQLPLLVPGSYEVRVVIDPQRRVQELDKENNEMVVSFRVITPRKPDLAIIQLAFDPPSLVVLPGQPVRIAVTIENIGDAVSGAFSVQCALRRVEEPTPLPIPRPNDVPGLAPGERATRTCEVRTDGLRPGFYELSVVIDPENRIDEQREDNNAASTGTGLPGEPSPAGQALLVQGPDLVPDRATLKVTPEGAQEPLPPGPPTPRLSQGAVLTLEVTVRNRGALAAGGFEVAFCIRAVPAQAACTEIGTRARTTGLGLQDEFIAKGQLNTQTLAPGLYEIGVIVDPTDQDHPFGRVEEINERNNVIGGAVAGAVPGLFVEIAGQVGLVDLAVQTVTTSPAQGFVSRGQIVRISAVIANLGTAPSGQFSIEFSYRNLLGSPGTTPVFSRQTVTNLDGSSRTTVTADLNTISLSPGTYEIVVTVDPENRISEPDETNNSLAIFITVN